MESHWRIESVALKNKARMHFISKLQNWKLYPNETLEIIMFLKYLAEFDVPKHLCYLVTTKRVTVPAGVPTVLYNFFNYIVSQKPTLQNNTHHLARKCSPLDWDLDFIIKVERAFLF